MSSSIGMMELLYNTSKVLSVGNNVKHLECNLQRDYTSIIIYKIINRGERMKKMRRKHESEDKSEPEDKTLWSNKVK